MTDDALDALYQDILLDHYRNPRHKGCLEESSCSHDNHNPLCGDHVSLSFLLSEDGLGVKEVSFEGKGCSISQASSSILCQCVQGKSVAFCVELLESVEAMILKKEELPSDTPEDVRALQGIQRFPGRYKCALLPWQCLSHCLRELEESS